MAAGLLNRPPAWPVAGVAPPPNRAPPVWGVLVPLAAGFGNEKGDPVEAAAPPKRPPAAGAVDVEGWPDAAPDAGVPKVKDMVVCASEARWRANAQR